ncbi:response regulator transcription factor [Halorussus pelagicus]|uniref:response regulator transcription factor n=1 Tax=Halorussus pelagicus TaxID=2505977 RepID=UPI000FFC9DE7|nr:response regulator transcription factor [Halorussus pelagicus]
MGVEPWTESETRTRASNVLLVGEAANLCTEWLPRLNVTTASDGEIALAVADADVDAMLIPQRCPDLSGDELVSKLRDRGVEAPAAVVLPEASDADVLELGFDDYVCRPLTERKIETVLRRLIKRQTYNRLLRRYYRLAICQTNPVIREDESSAEARARIEAELRDVQDQLAAIESEMAADEYEDLFRDLQRALADAAERSEG